MSNTTRPSVTIYTDGSCLGNGKQDSYGGWAAILTYKNIEKILRGRQAGAKNNQMELTAAIEGIRALKQPCRVTIVTDSQYVCRCFSSISEWRQNNWRTKAKAVPANLDLLKELVDVGTTGQHEFRFQYVAGHSGHTYNERCDKIAREQAMKAKRGE